MLGNPASELIVLAGMAIEDGKTIEDWKRYADYNGVGKIQYLLGQRNITILDSQYADQVMLTVLIPEEQKERTLAELTDLTNGKAGIEVQDEVAFGILDKHVILLDNR